MRHDLRPHSKFSGRSPRRLVRLYPLGDLAGSDAVPPARIGRADGDGAVCVVVVPFVSVGVEFAVQRVPAWLM